MEGIADSQRTSAFKAIYDDHIWAGASRSGPGSDPSNTVEYVAFVNDWLASHDNVRTIVEVGCGDWSTSSLIRFGDGRDYLGLDIVEAVVRQNTEKHATPAVRFAQCDFIEEAPPAADLLIAKDVLQHLSNASVLQFIRETLPRYRYAILTNDVAKVEVVRLPLGLRYRRRLDKLNRDIRDGESRSIDVRAAPFNLNAVQVRTYDVVLREQPRRLVYTKQIAIVRSHSKADLKR